MRLAILIVLVPAVVVAYPYPQRTSEISRPARGNQRFNIEEIPASASDMEPILSLARKGNSQRRLGHESQREPETASSVVAPVTQQLVSSRITSQRRGIALAPEDKFRSRNNSNRRGFSSQDIADRAFPSRRREPNSEVAQISSKSPQLDEDNLESNKENYPTTSQDIARNIPSIESSTSPFSSSPSPLTATGRRRSSSRNSDFSYQESPPKSAISGFDVSSERQTRFESSRRRQPSGLENSASEGRRSGRRNLSRGTARANLADFSSNSATNTQDSSNRSRNSGRKDSTPPRRVEKVTISPQPSFTPRTTQSRLTKENENINNDIPVLEIPEEPSLTASKRMDTLDDTSEEPASSVSTENISSEPESSSVPVEDNLSSSSSEHPSTPDYSENTPKPFDSVPSNRRKSSSTKSEENARDSILEDRNIKSRSRVGSPTSGSNTNTRRGGSRGSRLNYNIADNGSHEEAINVNSVNYRRDSSSNTPINSRRSQTNTKSRNEESEANVAGISLRGSSKRNWEASKNTNDVNTDAGISTLPSYSTPRISSSRRSNAPDTSRRPPSSERRGGRGYNIDNAESRVEETSPRRGSRTRSNVAPKAELNSVDSARSGRRTTEADVISTSQRTSRRSSPDGGRRGSAKVRSDSGYD